MRKLGILMLALAVLFGMSTVALADNVEVDVGVEVSVSPYAAIYHVSDWYDNFRGLFPEDNPISEPGLYISDGGVTVNYAKELWPIAEDLEAPNVDDMSVNLIMVDTNHEVNVEMTVLGASDGELIPGFPESGLQMFIRTSTHEDIVQDEAGDFVPSGDDFFDELVLRAQGIGQNWRVDSEDAQIHITNGVVDYGDFSNPGSGNTFTVTPERCSGPYLYHLNGGLLLEKADALLYGEDLSFTLQLTLETSI